MNYQDFLHTKIDIAPESGFDISDEEINPALKPHQRDAVRWAVKGGRRALFESFGLGKTAQQLEYCRIITEREGGQALIILPLGVKQEFQRDAARLLGMEEPPYVRTMEEVVRTIIPDAITDSTDSTTKNPDTQTKPCILLTNYERVRDGDIDPAYFTAVSLDEASVLRSFGSKTYQTFLSKLKGIPYKLVCTATPSPNRYKELIHYAGYLEIMDTGQALTRFFQRDSGKAGNLTLYPSREKEFWLWVSSWALFIERPSDLGYDNAGYDLPKMDVRWHCVQVDNTTAGADKRGQMKLVRDAALSLQDAAREKRDSIPTRLSKLVEIVDEDPGARFILWHDLEDERRAIKAALPEAVEIYGSQDISIREANTIAFSDGEFRLLATKKELSGSGCNFQRHCHRAVFMGIDYEFNDFIQAIHRIYRFLQTEKVVIDIIYTESEQTIRAALMTKWRNHDKMVRGMIDLLKTNGLNNLKVRESLRRKMGVERVEVRGARYTAVLNDCVEELCVMEENSVDLIVTSIPFGNHYEYSANYNDFGHNPDTERFFMQMDFLSPELLRVLNPGRVFACHVKDRVLFGNATGTGMPTMEPFHALCIQHYMRHGFQYFGMITVVTDVVRENNQTYRLGWSMQCRDGTKMGVGCPEYILLFRKLPSDTSDGFADVPVEKSKEEYTRAQWQIDAHGYWRSSGDRFLSGGEIEKLPLEKLQSAYRKHSRETVYDYAGHVEMAKRLDAEDKLPASFMVVAPGSWTGDVWDDVNRIKTLNTNQSARRQEKHVCPLQIDIVDRLINRYSNKDELVLDPFAGLFTVPVRALEAGRRGYGVELNADYFRDGVGYLKAADAEVDMPTLFDFLEDGAAVGAR